MNAVQCKEKAYNIVQQMAPGRVVTHRTISNEFGYDEQERMRCRLGIENILRSAAKDGWLEAAGTIFIRSDMVNVPNTP